jgi:hypothetical protein
MRDTANFSVFGGVYPAEVHSHNPIPGSSNSCTATPLVAILFAFVVGLSATSGAVAALKSASAGDYGFLLAGNMEISGVPTLREVLW